MLKKENKMLITKTQAHVCALLKVLQLSNYIFHLTTCRTLANPHMHCAEGDMNDEKVYLGASSLQIPTLLSTL